MVGVWVKAAATIGGDAIDDEEVELGELGDELLPFVAWPFTRLEAGRGVASIVPTTTCAPLGAVFTIICLPSGVVKTFCPPAVVDSVEPSGAVKFWRPDGRISPFSKRAFLGAATSSMVSGSVEAGLLPLPFIFLYCSASPLTMLSVFLLSSNMEAKRPAFSGASKSFFGEDKMPSRMLLPLTSSFVFGTSLE